MTPSQVLTVIRNNIVETATTGAFWTDPEIYAHMWYAEYQIATRTKSTEFHGTLTSVTNQSDYTKSATVMFIQSVKYNGYPLKKITFRDRDSLEGVTYGGSYSVGNPQYYIEYSSYVSLYPVPNAANAIRLNYIGRPSEISTASTAFSIPEEQQYLIPHWCLSQMISKDQDPQGRDFHTRQWEAGLKRAEIQWADRQNFGRNSRVICEEDYPGNFLGIM